MKNLTHLIGSFLLLTLFESFALAQNSRTFVSGHGVDTNPCSLTAPCRTFTQALSQTNAGGEVVVLDSAGYGPFAITKAVTIEAPSGVYAGITVTAGDGIDINAAAPNTTPGTVILRGLTINNQGASGGGVVVISVGTLYVENCVINGFSSETGGPQGSGIGGLGFLCPGNLEVKDSVMRGNTNGILIEPSSGTALGVPPYQTAVVSLDHVRLEGNLNYGLEAESGSNVSAHNSIASGNFFFGFFANASTAPIAMDLVACVASNNEDGGIEGAAFGPAAAVVNIEGCAVTGNNAFSGSMGILAQTGADGPSTIRLSNSIVTDNTYGLKISGGGMILSRGNNTVAGNRTADISGTIGSYSAQ